MNYLHALLELISVGGFSLNSLTPGKLVFYRGDDVTIKFWIRDLEGRSVPIAGYTVSFDLDAQSFSSTLTSSSSGQGEVTLSSAQTEGLSAGVHTVTLVLTRSADSKRTRIKLKNAIEAKDL